ASGLIRSGALQNAIVAEPGAARTYSAAVNWKSPGKVQLRGDSNLGLECIRDELGQFVLSKTEWIPFSVEWMLVNFLVSIYPAMSLN
ncbi:hypothetical protein A2U01_0053618, partial [Trifolium medium]|nr:hypothetical protein [Trifolium medium]